MKIVREHLNEIKQDIEGSGLGAIGVGKAGTFKGYKILTKTQPGIEKKIDSTEWYFRYVPEKKMINKICEVLGSKLSNILWFPDWLYIGNYSIANTTFIDDMLAGANFERITFDQDEYNENRKKLEDDVEIEGGFYYNYDARYYPGYKIIRLDYTNSTKDMTRDGYLIAQPNDTNI